MRTSAKPAATKPARPIDDQLVPRNQAYVQLCTTPSTAWRREFLKMPGWPMPVTIGNRVFYWRSEINRFLANLQPAVRGNAQTGYQESLRVRQVAALNSGTKPAAKAKAKTPKVAARAGA